MKAAPANLHKQNPIPPSPEVVAEMDARSRQVLADPLGSHTAENLEIARKAVAYADEELKKRAKPLRGCSAKEHQADSR